MATESPGPVSETEGPPKGRLDTKTIEMLAASVFRTIFGRGVRVPLRKKGMMDMDLMVRDNNVILNLNSIQMHAPELLIWRITFAYEGKPVVEYGRGIKNDMKIHLPQLCFLLLSIWRDKRKLLKARAAGVADQDRDLAAMSVAGRDRGKIEDTTV